VSTDSMSPVTQVQRVLARCLPLVAFLLPLATIPGLQSTFSTPKLVVLGSVVALGLPIAVVLRATRFRLPFPFEAALLFWLVSLSLSSILGAAVSMTALLIQFFGVGWFALVVLAQPPAEELAAAIIVSGAVISVVALLQYLGIDPFVLAGWTPVGIGNSRMRVYATLGSPNFVAAFLTSLVPLTVGLARRLSFSSKRLARVALAIFGLELLAIAATGSRAPVLGLLGGALCWALLSMQWAMWRTWAALAVTCITLIVLSPARSLNTTVEGRVYLWRITAQHIQEAPWFGLGPGAFEAFFPRWETDWQAARSQEGNSITAGLEDHAHNDFLEIWVEQGTFGLLSFLGVVTTFFLQVKRSLDSDRELLAGAAASVVSMLTVSLVDFPFHRVEECFLFWTLVGSVSIILTSGVKRHEPTLLTFAR